MRENQPGFPVDSKPAFVLLRQTQAAMAGVSSYHFTLDNTNDSHTKEANDFSQQVNGHPLIATHSEGDVVPPVARFSNADGLDGRGYIMVNQQRYVKSPSFFAGPNDYLILPEDTNTWYVLNGALQNPQQYINYTLDNAMCATIIGSPSVGGVTTIHLRFVVPHDEFDVKDTSGRLEYVRDIWVDKSTHYVRQVQAWELSNLNHPCEYALSFASDQSRIFYTTGILTFSQYNQPISPPIPSSISYTEAGP